MTTMADLFPHLQTLTFADLTQRRKEIIGDRTQARELTDSELDECSAIVAILRRKNSGPPREEAKAKPAKAAKAAALTGDSLFNL